MTTTCAIAIPRHLYPTGLPAAGGIDFLMMESEEKLHKKWENIAGIECLLQGNKNSAARALSTYRLAPFPRSGENSKMNGPN